MVEKLTQSELAKEYANAFTHYGHPIKELNPQMSPYILCIQDGYHIFDLVQTSQFLNLAGDLLENIAETNGTFLFVGTSKLFSLLIKKEALRANSFYINYRWLGGTLTNWSTIQKQVEQLNSFETNEYSEIFKKLSKKEQSSKKREANKLHKLFDGIKNMRGLPDAVIFTNQLEDDLAIQECLELGIPVISIVDSNCNPSSIPYIIPANDDSGKSISFILNILVNRILDGYARKENNILQLNSTI